MNSSVLVGATVLVVHEHEVEAVAEGLEGGGDRSLNVARLGEIGPARRDLAPLDALRDLHWGEDSQQPVLRLPVAKLANLLTDDLGDELPELHLPGVGPFPLAGLKQLAPLSGQLRFDPHDSH